VMLDGQPAWRGTFPMFGSEYCARRGVRYVIQYDMTDRATLEAIAASWRWRRLESPAKNAELAEQPVPVAGGRFTLRLPTWALWARNFAPPHRNVTADYFSPSTFLENTPTAPFYLAVSMNPTVQGMSLNDISRQVGDDLKRGAKSSKPVRFKRIAASGGGIISEVVDVPGNAQLPYMIQAYVSPDARSRVVLTFTFGAPDENVRAAYAALAETIAASVRAAPTTKPTTRP